MSELKRTPLFPEYELLGAKVVDFGGWEMPVQFTGIKQEHEATRTKAGLFDVSHMGEVTVKGPKSEEFLQKVTTNDVSKLKPGRAHYTFFCYKDGGTVDDLLIYKLADEDYLLVINAGNTDKDFDWLVENNDYSAEELELKNVSAEWVQLALQGPIAEEVLQTMTDEDLSEIKFFGFKENVKFKGIEQPAIVSRTGYTGEDGFEVYLPAAGGRDLWKAILEAGKDKGVLPVGLGARDSLRFEAGLPLYGQELSKDITPIEAGLKFAVKVDKDSDFNGKEVLKDQVENGTARKLVGIEMIDKGIPRTDYPVFVGDEEIGFVTTGTQSPTLGKNIGNVLIKTEYAQIGQEVEIQVRKKKLKAVVAKTPFYKR
ncbi:glycine cleavage system aminomethyltransferase GcvT [Aciduricibacillus chroicocephali]|uniref:Aminomethyltransferase n=1 Tax=Aciduricibacillus chroicocephali TaxID=3054939 RepID=A0ABY9KRV2_9BACI|nr:glycine cleavage system aminomethyltransferase GcvT [Bacillaceae bacterium 44XB]